VYVLCLSAVLANMFVAKRQQALIGLGFIVVGAIVYFLFARRNQSSVVSPPDRVTNA
jgi:hypothetical protein